MSIRVAELAAMVAGDEDPLIDELASLPDPFCVLCNAAARRKFISMPYDDPLEPAGPEHFGKRFNNGPKNPLAILVERLADGGETQLIWVFEVMSGPHGWVLEVRSSGNPPRVSFERCPTHDVILMQVRRGDFRFADL